MTFPPDPARATPPVRVHPRGHVAAGQVRTVSRPRGGRRGVQGAVHFNVAQLLRSRSSIQQSTDPSSMDRGAEMSAGRRPGPPTKKPTHRNKEQDNG